MERNDMEPDVRKYEELQNNTDRLKAGKYTEPVQISRDVDSSTDRIQWNDNADEYGLS